MGAGFEPTSSSAAGGLCTGRGPGSGGGSPGGTGGGGVNPNPQKDEEAKMEGTRSDEAVGIGVPLQKLLLKPEEAAVLLSVGRSRVYELMAAAKLESVRIGGSRRIPVAALDAFVKQLQEEAVAGRWWQR